MTAIFTIISAGYDACYRRFGYVAVAVVCCCHTVFKTDKARCMKLIMLYVAMLCNCYALE